MTRPWGLLACLVVLPAAAQDQGPEILLDIGDRERDDEGLLVERGIYPPEGPNARSRVPFYRDSTLRWFGNQWRMQLPVFARRGNQVTLRARFTGRCHLTVADGWQVTLEGRGDEGYLYLFHLPAEAVGDEEQVTLEGRHDPAARAAAGGDQRELAMAVDWIRVRPLDAAPPATLLAAGGRVWQAGRDEHLLNVGLAGDEAVVVAGGYQHEGPNAASRSAFYRQTSYRWMANRWTLRLPVYPHRINEVTLRALLGRMLELTCGDGWRTLLFGRNLNGVTYTFYLPAEMVGGNDHLDLSGRAIPPAMPRAEGDRRELAFNLDWVRIRPVDRIPEGYMAIAPPPDTKEPDLPLPDRLRGTEMRPLFGDLDSYLFQARLMRCNVMTIGPMNGQHFTAFPTKDGIPHANMQPDFIPNQIRMLHEAGIAAIGWLPFNVQDMRSPDQCQAANKYPQYTMQFIPWEGRAEDNRVGMCVVSSPWREIHGGILKEAAALGLDGVFFDGFYLGGIPHPSAPGCTCDHCRAKFKAETGLDQPAKVDWRDPTFKRWVRWRNEKLIETAIYFRDRMREANPELQVTCNYNLWPFANKDWETAIPMWSTDQFGVSQHAYSGRLDMEWLMLGFKSRLSHDLNPAHCDIWRTSSPAWKYDDSPEDRQRHELTMRTFMLSGLSYGVTPWHGGHLQPAEAGIRIHEAVRDRERFFSHDELRHLGVVVSENSHAFWGHLPGTENVADYQDTLLGAWLLLTEHHLPFRFVFDNQLEAGELGDFKVILAPKFAAVSDAAVAKLKEWAANGGRLIVTGDSGACDAWVDPRGVNAFAEVPGLVRLEGRPVLDWLRTRDEAAGQRVLDALAAVPSPLVVEGPKSLAAVPMWGPGRRELWVHLLNVSAFYPLGDTGFRGLGHEAVYAGDVASDADILKGGKVQRVNLPAAGVIVSAPGLKVRSARLGVAGTPLSPDAQGRFAVPPVEVHDVVVLTLD